MPLTSIQDTEFSNEFHGGVLPSIEGYAYTKMVNISPATPVADYTIRLDLNATFNYAACQPDGDDIRFFDNSNT
ncbi:MAG: hypothetical protein Q6353_008185, partial [Candidatus Sigynarchaeum springense]